MADTLIDLRKEVGVLPSPFATEQSATVDLTNPEN